MSKIWQLLNHVLVIVVASVGFFASPAYSGSLEELEGLIAEYKIENMDQFLANKEFQEAYFKALQDYYGKHKFQRQAFNAILADLKRLSEDVPEIKERFFETKGLGAEFAIETGLKTAGVELKAKEWEAFYGKWQAGLKSGAKEFFEIKDERERISKATALLEQYQYKLRSFESQIRGLPRKKAALARSEFYRSIKNDVKFKALSDYVMQLRISEGMVSDSLLSKDADLILDTMDRLSARGGLDPIGKLKVPEELRSLIVDVSLPKLELPALEVIDGVPKETEFFRVAVKTSNRGKAIPVGRGPKKFIEFKPIPRRVHGIWKGISIGECVGGGGGLQGLCTLTPERWATSALKDSRLYHVEVNGRYYGFIGEVPGTIDGKLYHSVDFGASILSDPIFIKDPRTGELKKELLYDEWLRIARRRLPKGSNGFVVGNSAVIANAGVVKKVQQHESYLYGKTVAQEGGKFELSDPLAKQIIKQSSRYAGSYGGAMIFDAVVPQTTELRKVVAYRPEAIVRVAIAVFKSKSASNAQKIQAIKTLGEEGKLKPAETVPILIKAVGDSDNEIVRAAETNLRKILGREADNYIALQKAKGTGAAIDIYQKSRAANGCIANEVTKIVTEL